MCVSETCSLILCSKVEILLKFSSFSPFIGRQKAEIWEKWSCCWSVSLWDMHRFFSLLYLPRSFSSFFILNKVLKSWVSWEMVQILIILNLEFPLAPKSVGKSNISLKGHKIQDSLSPVPSGCVSFKNFRFNLPNLRFWLFHYQNNKISVKLNWS